MIKHPSIAAAVAGMVLAVCSVSISLTSGGRTLLLTVAALGGAFYTHIYRRSLPAPLGLEQSALVGCVVGAIAVVLGLLAGVLASVNSGMENVFSSSRLHSLVIVSVQLLVASGCGGLAVGILSRLCRRRTIVEDS